MKYSLSLALTLLLATTLSAQTKQVYTINADSTKLTGCDSNELIIENHTRGVSGFLYNTGNGRTIFKRGLLKLNDSLYLIGADTLKVLQNYWRQGGNVYGATGVFGTLDSNHIDFYTNNTRRGRWMANGNLLLGTTTDNGNIFQANGNIYCSQQLQVGSFTPGFTTGATIITQGQVRATGGLNLRDPSIGDNSFSGVKANGSGVAIYSGSNPIFTTFFVGSSASGSVVSVAAGLNPTSGSGTVQVLDMSSANIQMLSGSNSIVYNYFNLAPSINQGTYGTGITRGLYINPNLTAAADWRSIETVKGDNRFNTSSGKTGIGINGAPTSKLDIAGDSGYAQLRLRTTYTPSSSTDTNGNTGDFSWDGDYFYIKTATGWKRAALTTF
ncbi:MAG TPA: hypothetical protein VHD83_17845 [Puia sp.]|nr:hypothetical protein [Puia sp.]